MSTHTKAVVLVLRVASVIVASVGLSVSLTWLAYAVYFAPASDLLSPQSALLSLLFPIAAFLLCIVSKPLAQLLTVDLNEFA